MTAGELQQVAASDAKLVIELATKSKNLKGTFQRVLKNATAGGDSLGHSSIGHVANAHVSN